MVQDYLKGKKVIKFAAIILGLACFLVVVRMFIIFNNPISYSYGGREIDLPFGNYRAMANGGPSIKFFGGIREIMSLTVLDGRRIVWELSAEIYPKSLTWRGSTIDFHDGDNTIIFYQGQHGLQGVAFLNIMVMTPDIMDLSQISEYKGRSEISSKSENGRYEAFAMSDTDKMELVIRDSNQNIIWQCNMLNCSSVIDWHDCNVVWDDSGTVLFDYKSRGNSYIRAFSMRTIPLLDPEEDESFFY